MSLVAVPESPPAPVTRRAGHIDLLAPRQRAPLPDMVLGLGGIAAQGAVRFFYSVAIAAVTTAVALGTVNSLLSVAMLASILWPAATGFAASKYVALARSRGADDEVRQVARHLGRSVLVATAILAVLAAVVSATVLGVSFTDSVMCALLVAAYSLATYVRGLLYGVGHIPRATGWDVGTAAAALVGLALALATDVSTSLLLLPLTITYAGYVAGNWPFAQGGSPLAEDLRHEIDHFIRYATLGSLAGAGLAQLAMVIAKVATSASDAGHFAAALSLAAPAGLLANAVMLVTAPTLADRHGRGEQILARARTDEVTRSVATCVLALCGASILASDPLLRLCYGSGFSDSGSILRVLLVAVLIPALAAGAISSLLVTHPDGQRVFARCNVAGLAVGLVVTVILLGFSDDVVVVAWGYLAGASVVGLAPLVIVWRREHHHWLGLTVRLLVGGAVLVSLCEAQTQLVTGAWWGVALAAVFAVAWLTVCRNDLPGLSFAITRPAVSSLDASPSAEFPFPADPRP
jgi:O-antigen/teichoic acid export membrane protein